MKKQEKNIKKWWNSFFLENLNADWLSIFNKNNILEDIESILLKINDFDNVFPKKENIFKIFQLTNPNNLKVVILGQDPYHNLNQASGIAFSVSNDVKTPPSLKNIFKELKNDLNIDHFKNNDLTEWAIQGVLLLNSSLTVEKNKANSHKYLKWNKVIIKILNELNIVNPNLIYCLWGNDAKNIYNKIEHKGEMWVISSSHPSPFSYNFGFKNSKPFSKINNFLKSLNVKPINWEK